MLLSLIAGALADNWDRRLLMAGAHALMLLFSATLAILAFVDALTPLSLLLLTFLVGSGAALNTPAWQASVGDLVSRKQLPQAILLNSVGYNVTRSAGPALGGALVAAAGAAVAFAANALSQIALIAVLLRVKSFTVSDKLPRESIAGAIQAGLRYVIKAPAIRTVLMRAKIFGVASAALQALLPLIARDMLGGGAQLYGLLLGLFGLGAIAGAMASVKMREWIGHEWTIRLGFAGQALAAGIIAVGAPLLLVATALFLAGITWVLARSLFNATIQLATPRWVVARTLALYQTLTFGGMALGSWIFGLLTEQNGLQIAMACAAAMLLAGVAIGFVFPMPETTPDNLAPVNRWIEPKAAIDLNARSGPIMVTIKYTIDERYIAEFLRLMDERRRIRQRNGALGWALTRDIERTELWAEFYRLSSWTDYIRHNRRTTEADAENAHSIRALNGGKLPKVTRRLVRSKL